MPAKKKVAIFLTILILCSVFPTSATAVTSINCVFTQGKEDAYIPLVLSEDITIEPLQNVRTDRIENIFPDPNLAAVIADAFGVSVRNFVTQSDLNRVLAFSANERNIQNLQGMQYLRNLREVSLLDNRISNLQPLANLTNLERLLLDHNRISDITPLQNLISLQWLWLDDNQITNVQALARLENLVWLTLWGNRIESISGLQNLSNLVALWLADNRISTIGALSNLHNLETLSLSGNHILDLRPLANLNQMQLIWIGRQTRTLAQRLIADPFSITSPLISANGQSVTPAQVSHDGVYAYGRIYWQELDPNTRYVSFSFSENIYVGLTSDTFSGTITQPTSRTPFSDVAYTNWFYNAVAFVFAEHLMGGVSNSRFAPDDFLNRAMATTVLYRLAGSPATTFHPIFTDIPTNTWYAPAAIWAAQHGIVHGYGAESIFHANGTVTREQFATLLHRFAIQNPYFPMPPAEFHLQNFADYQQISPWAYESMRFAVYHGFFGGTPAGALQAAANMTRAECALVLMRFAAYLSNMENPHETL